MLSENEVRLIRKAIHAMPGPEASYAACLLRVVLEDDTPVSLVSPTPEEILDAPAEKTLDQRQIEDLQAALTATRERADRAELKYLELKRNGG